MIKAQEKKKGNQWISCHFYCAFVGQETSDNSTEHGNVNDVSLFNIYPN